MTAGVLATCAFLSPRITQGESPHQDSPLLLFSTYFGGSASDYASVIAFGPDGVLWILGSSYSTDIPGAPRIASSEEDEDVFVMRFDPDALTVLSMAWIGGDGSDRPAAIAFDADGAAYIVGLTGDSATFPVTADIPRPIKRGNSAFIARVSPDGSGFSWSAVLGGGREDNASGVAVTTDGDPVVYGTTSSMDFPLERPNQAQLSGPEDAFVARVKADGTGLVFSTFIGGTLTERAGAIGIGPSGELLLGGTTDSTDFPAAEVLLGASGGYLYGYLAELAPDGSTVRRAALFENTTVDGIAVDSSNRLLLLGSTTAPDFPAPQSPHGPPGPWGDAYLLRMDPVDWTLLHGALYGGLYSEGGLSMSQAADGTIWMAGSTDWWGLPLSGAIRPAYGSHNDTFAAAFEPNGLGLLFSTYLGGDDHDFSGGIAVAEDGSAWLTGGSASSNFPLANPLQGRSSPPLEYDDFLTPPLVYDMFLTHIASGDPGSLPQAPGNLDANALDGNNVSLHWDDLSSNEIGFAVFRSDWNLGYDLVALLPAETMEWVDGTVLPDRQYTYLVQAVGEAGGSLPSTMVETHTPPTLDTTISRGRCRNLPDPYIGKTVLCFQGRVATNAASRDGDFDPVGEGIQWFMSPAGFPAEGALSELVNLLTIPPGDPGWNHSSRLHRWESSGARLTINSRTGRYRLRVRKYGWAWPKDEEHVVRVTMGDDAGSTVVTWKSMGSGRLRTRQ